MTVVEKIDKFLYERGIGKMVRRKKNKKSEEELDKIYKDLNKRVKKWREGSGFENDMEFLSYIMKGKR